MCDILIFGGTTEGRQLAEFCAGHGINACISVATEYGAELLPHCLLYTSPSPRDVEESRMPSSA